MCKSFYMILFWLTLLVCCDLGALAAEDTAWRQEANRRIAEHRQGDFQLTISMADGSVPSKVVAIHQIKHHFRFGTCVNGSLINDKTHGERYRSYILDHFNTLVSENYMKWYATEKEAGVFSFDEADAQLDWAKRHGMHMRGHCLLWAKERFVQDWLKKIPDDQLWERIDSHLERTLKHIGNRVYCWDAINEMLDGDYFVRRLGEDAHTRCLLRMQELAPDMPLYLNEYSIIDNDKKCQRYIDMLQSFVKAGVSIDGIAIQEHAAERFVASEQDKNRKDQQFATYIDPVEVWQRLDRLHATGLPIHLSEISFRTFDEQRKAEALDIFYTTAFAHPGVEAILLWGFWEPSHWLGRHAALVDRDWRRLPAAERLHEILNKRWKSSVKAKTADGKISFRGFYGRYRIRCQGEMATVWLRPGQTAVTVQLKGKKKKS